MLLPKEKESALRGGLSAGRQVPGRGMIDFFPLEAEPAIQRVLKLDWNTPDSRVIPASAAVLAPRADAQDQLTFLQDASAAVKAEAQAGKCWDPVEKELKLPKYSSWPGYEDEPAVRAAPLLRAVGQRNVKLTRGREIVRA